MVSAKDFYGSRCRSKSTGRWVNCINCDSCVKKTRKHKAKR